MKNIRESMANINSLTDHVNSVRVDAVDEGLKDILNGLRKKFQDVVKFFKGFAAKISKKLPYWCPVDAEGEISPAVLPATAGAAMKGGYINKATTNVVLKGSYAKMSGYKGKTSDSYKLYPSGNSLKYYEKLINESTEVKRPLNFNIDRSPLTPEQIIEENQARILKDLENINEVKMGNSDAYSRFNVVANEDLIDLITIRLMKPDLPSLLVWGAPGIGKTAVLEATLREYDKKGEYNLIVKTLSNETPDNFTLPEYTGEGEDRRKHDVPASWLPLYKVDPNDSEGNAARDAACGKGLLFIDELSRATDQVLNVVLPLVNERRFNEYKLGSGWTIICATNRLEDEASGQAMLGKALKNRFANVYYEPTCNDWIEWAKTQNFISPALLQWLALPESENMSGGKFFYYDPEEEADNENPSALMCTPRSWTNAMRELAVWHHTGKLEGWNIFDIPDRILKRTLNLYVPSNAVEGFMSFLRILQAAGDVRQISEDIWAGKKIATDLSTIKKAAIPLSQVIVTMHADQLPTEEEFINLADWVVGLGWGQMASYILDVFINTFAVDANASYQVKQGSLFVSKAKRNSLSAVQLSKFNNALTQTLSKYGISSIAEIPDYSKGLMIMAKKYQADIAKYIDGI